MQFSTCLVVFVLCSCLEASVGRSIWNGDDRAIVKRDLADDFFDKLVEKGKSLFSDDEPQTSEPSSRREVTATADNNNHEASENFDTSNPSTHSTSETLNTDRTPTKSEDSIIDEKTLKMIIQKGIAYLSSTEDNDDQGSSTTDGNDSDALMEKLGSILLKEGVKIGVAELASSVFGK